MAKHSRRMGRLRLHIQAGCACTQFFAFGARSGPDLGRNFFGCIFWNRADLPVVLTYVMTWSLKMYLSGSSDMCFVRSGLWRPQVSRKKIITPVMTVSPSDPARVVPISCREVHFKKVIERKPETARSAVFARMPAIVGALKFFVRLCFHDIVNRSRHFCISYPSPYLATLAKAALHNCQYGPYGRSCKMGEPSLVDPDPETGLGFSVAVLVRAAK